MVGISVVGISLCAWGDVFLKPEDYKAAHYTGSLMVWLWWGYVLGRIMRRVEDKYLEF